MNVEKGNLSAKLAGIRTVDGVRALAPGIGAGVPTDPSLLLTAHHVANPMDACAFEKAGWTFIKADRPDAAATGQKVVVDTDGHLKILASALNVKFGPSVPKRMVETILGRLGLVTRRNLGFSPNLFLVDDPTGNALSTAMSLNRLDDVIYAEPVLIEVMEAR